MSGNKPSGKTDRYWTSVENLETAIANLSRSLALPIMNSRDLSGIIKDFEIAYELGWKTLKKYLEKEGHETQSVKETFATAYQLGYLQDEKTWLRMIQDRNLTVHTYDQEFATELCKKIGEQYLSALNQLLSLLKKSN